MRHILITGATSGIGLALTKLALANEYRVSACGRNTAVLEELKHTNLDILRFDVSDQQQTSDALKNLQPDVVVLNAGTCKYVDVENFSTAVFKANFEVNVFGAIHVLEALLPTLKSDSQLVFVDSLARLFPFNRASAYGASKAALNYIANSLRVDLPNLIVQTVSPGFVKTPLTDQNTFSMPMLVTAESAASSILKGIESKKTHIQFPFLFTLFIRLLGSMPMSWQTRIGRKMKDQ